MMDDPTKDAVPRSAVEYICRKETVNTNPDGFAHNEMFIRYLDHDAISSFGRWQWANGFNTALVAVKCGLDKIPTVEPMRKRGRWILDRSGAYCCSECMEPCAGYVMMRPRDKFCKMCGSYNGGDKDEN